jgi:hypothetical protein
MALKAANVSMKNLGVICVLVTCLHVAAVPASACSVTGCLDRGVEMRSGFAVNIKHVDKPLAGVSVEITASQDTIDAKKFSVTTDKGGIAHINNLLPGDYWLNAEYLGIGAAYHCFHVNQKPSKKAKRKLAYDWGDLAPATRRIAGKLVDAQPNKEGTPIQRLLHRVEVPIPNAKMKLQNATTGAVYNASSEANGTFAFDGVPTGTYVLHINAGAVSPDRGYDASDVLIALVSSAKQDSLLLRYQEPGGGSCGGTSLELQEGSR